MKRKEFIPALKYSWLTNFFDPVLALTMPEKRFKEALINQAQINSGDMLLDFGCGTGTLSVMIKESFPDTRVIGLDVDEKIISIANEKIAKRGIEILIHKYSGNEIPFKDSTFDKVVSSLVFHHLNSKQKENALNELHRVLKPGGELHIADWGLPANTSMKIFFYMVQLLDGFETTNDNVKGLLPKYIINTGFIGVTETRKFNTIFGTLRLYRAVKPV